MRRIKRFIGILLLGLFLPAGAQETDYFEWAKQMEIMASALEQLMNNYVEEPSPDKLMSEALKGMLSQTDRFTNFYDEERMFEQRLRRLGKSSGIGATVKNKKEGLSIREIFKGSPAENAGLQIGDLIIEINDKPLKDLNFNEKMALIKGKPGSELTLKIIRQGKTRKINLTRQVFERKAVTFYKLLDRNIGYVKLDKFTKNASLELKEAIVELKEQGAEKLVLDLRNNPGGLLDQAIKIVNFFIPKDSLVVYTRGRFSNYNKTYKTKNLPLDEKIPLVVLINKGSASASEIVSGTLQDYDRAVIVGDTSYGKGLVQRFFPLRYGTYIKITISKYYIPSGRQIQKIDYWHRDKQGRTKHYKTDKSKIFHTSKGRKVYEHGGITPDVIIRPDTLPPLVKSLVKEDLIFDFNTQYFYKHPQPDLSDEEKIYNQFLDYVKQNQDKIKTPAEKELEKTLKKAKKEKWPEDLLKALRHTSKTLNREQMAGLEKNEALKKIIIQRIISDLLLRYEGKKARKEYLLEHDKVLSGALEILNNMKRYHQILNP